MTSLKKQNTLYHISIYLYICIYKLKTLAYTESPNETSTSDDFITSCQAAPGRCGIQPPQLAAFHRGQGLWKKSQLRPWSVKKKTPGTGVDEKNAIFGP